MQVSMVDYICLPPQPYDVSTLFLGSVEFFTISATALTFVVLGFLLNFSLADEGLCSLL